MKNHRFKIAPCIYRQLIYGRAIIAGMYGNNALTTQVLLGQVVSTEGKIKIFLTAYAKINSKTIKCNI